MLVQGTLILVREEGQRLAVEDLEIGGFVFDPLADKYCEIIDILARWLFLNHHQKAKSHTRYYLYNCARIFWGKADRQKPFGYHRHKEF